MLELAQVEFDVIFSEFTDLEIRETATMIRTDSWESVAVQFTHSSEKGDGVYGLEFRKNVSGSYEILQQNKDTAIDNLVK